MKQKPNVLNIISMFDWRLCECSDLILAQLDSDIWTAMGIDSCVFVSYCSLFGLLSLVMMICSDIFGPRFVDEFYFLSSMAGLPVCHMGTNFSTFGAGRPIRGAVTVRTPSEDRDDTTRFASYPIGSR